MAQANPSYTPSQIQAFLEGRAVDLGSIGKDSQFGAGRLALGAPPAANACTSVSLSPNPASPQASGTTVAWTASASGCGSPEYIFYLFDGAWSVAQSWSTNATFNWSTTGLAAGSYYIEVDVRNGSSGTSQTYRAVSYSLS